jgi:hypothetical protein
MPVRELPVLGAVERWIFAPGSARRLAGVRIGLCLLMAGRLSRPVYLQVAGQPRILFRRISFMRWFHSMPPADVVLLVQIAAVAACVLGALGLWTRVALPVAFLGALFLNGMWTSIGQPMHNETLLLLSFAPLLFAPSADAWSLDARRRGTSGDAVSVRYGWPVRTAMIVVAGGYFFSGVNKLAFSGVQWAIGDNLRWIMYHVSDGSPRPIGPALFVASHPLLAHLAAAGTLVVETLFPIVLWKPRAAWVFVPAVTLLYAGIAITMHLDYSAWALTTIVVFTPWDGLVDRARRRERVAEAVVPAGAGVSEPLVRMER